MVRPLPEIDRAFLSVLVKGAEKTFDNAEKLYFEAQLLAKAGATARALCLHQISLEECSKIETMGAWGVSLLSGHEGDRNKILAALRRHAVKNKNNAYMLEGSPEEYDAKARGDWDTAREEFKKRQREFHEESNILKNASLYVDWKDDQFVSPTEQITLEALQQIIERNETFLGYAHNSLRLLKRLDTSPDDYQGLFVEFMDGAEKLRAEKPDDLMTAKSELLDRFMEAGLKALRNRSK
jgi:AbiV family abortive infection protein